MPGDASAGIIAHAIQLSVAPVFLLSGVAGLLAVMVMRLARIIDRARSLEASWPGLDVNARNSARVEMRSLERRRRSCSWSISYCAIAALLVCTVIVTLFVEEFFATDLKWVTGILFVGAMAALICGLARFLHEVYIASQTIRIDLARYE